MQLTWGRGVAILLRGDQLIFIMAYNEHVRLFGAKDGSST